MNDSITTDPHFFKSDERVRSNYASAELSMRATLILTKYFLPHYVLCKR